MGVRVGVDRGPDVRSGNVRVTRSRSRFEAANYTGAKRAAPPPDQAKHEPRRARSKTRSGRNGICFDRATDFLRALRVLRGSGFWDLKQQHTQTHRQYAAEKPPSTYR